VPKPWREAPEKRPIGIKFQKIQKEDVMKGMRTIMNAVAVSLAFVPKAFAGTTKVYSSSILVLAFVGFLALVVVIQLIPAIMTLIGALKGIASKNEENRMAEVED
jgi:hypothetical protein